MVALITTDSLVDVAMAINLLADLLIRQTFFYQMLEKNDVTKLSRYDYTTDSWLLMDCD